MKATVKAMPKGKIAEALAEATELKRKDCMTMLNTLTKVATEEVKKTGKFSLPKVCRIVAKKRAATKATERMMFGKLTKVKPQPAKTIVKVYSAVALKKAV